MYFRTVQFVLVIHLSVCMYDGIVSLKGKYITLLYCVSLGVGKLGDGGGLGGGGGGGLGVAVGLGVGDGMWKPICQMTSAAV